MEHQGSPRFGGDMDRNEVEIDLNKFMALLQEKSELKDRIRELEDEYNRNPFQKVIFVAEALDSWRLIPRAYLGVYMYLLYYTTFWFMDLPDPTFEQSGLPIASGLIMGLFIFIVMKQIMDNLVGEIKTIQGITKMLITRATIMNNDMIRIDTVVSSALNIAPDLDRIARAQNFVEDGTIDARRD